MCAGSGFLCVGFRDPDFAGATGHIHELGGPCFATHNTQRVDQGFRREGRLVPLKPTRHLPQKGGSLTRSNIQRRSEVGFSLIQGAFSGGEGGVAHGVVCHEKTFASFGYQVQRRWVFRNVMIALKGPALIRSETFDPRHTGDRNRYVHTEFCRPDS